MGTSFKLVTLALTTLLLVACGRDRTRADVVQSASIPAGFDVTVIADKDNQFDFDGAPLTAEGYIHPSGDPEGKRLDTFSVFRLHHYPGKLEHQQD